MRRLSSRRQRQRRKKRPRRRVALSQKSRRPRRLKSLPSPRSPSPRRRKIPRSRKSLRPRSSRSRSTRGSSPINDAAPGRLFDAGATAPDPGDPNRLVIAFHSGVDPATFRVTDFRASTAAFNHLSAMDTISFKIEAPKGQRISKVIYTQRGTGSQIRLGRAAGATHWVVGEYAAQLGVFGTNPSLVGVADFSAQPQAVVDVSITTGLFAFAAPTSGSASIEVTSAEVQVELVPAID